MSKLFVFLLMIFLHIVDDYYLQGILASMKQKKWWTANAPDKKYKYDWVVVLIMHSMSWSFSIMFPIVLYNGFQVGSDFMFMFIMNTAIHAFIDDLKANKLEINLIEDQIAHITQIFLTAAIFLR